ncbi:MAG: hypothetical protein ACOYL6_05330 [Bacteriovoracaceae bacterium]
MNKTLKIFISGALAFVLIIGGLFFYASTKIRPEEIRKMTVNAIEKAMPGTTASLGKIDYSLGFNIKIEFQDLQIKLKEDNSLLMGVKDFHFKLPIWAIITNGGTVDLTVQKPVLNYVEYEAKVNSFTKAFGPKKEEEKKNEVSTGDDKSKSGQIEVPSFLSKSKINVRISDTDVKYQLADKSNGELEVNRFLLKDLNLTATTAFEIESDIHATLKDGKKFATHAMVIGQVNLNEFIKEKKVDTSVVVELKNTTFTGMAYKIPDMKSNIQVMMLPAGNINLEVDTSFGTVATNQLKVEMFEKKVNVKSFKLEVFLKELGTVLDKATAEKMAMVDFKNSNFTISGDVVMDDSQIQNSNIAFGLTQDILVKGSEGLNVSTGMKGKYNNENLQVNLNNKILDGTVNVEVRGKVNPTEKDFSVEKMAPIMVDVLANNIRFSPEMIRKNLYGKKAPVETEAASKDAEAATQAKEAPRAARKLPHVVVDARWKQIVIGKDEFSGGGKILVKGNSIGSEGIAFQFSRGKGNITFLNKQNPNLYADTKFTFSLNGLNLNSLQVFLPPALESIKGEFSGNVNGGLAEAPKNTTTYNVNFNLNATNGELKGLNLTEHIASIVSKLDMLKDKIGKKDLKVSDEFEKLLVKGNATDKLLTIDTFDFVGIKNSTSVTGKGHVGQPNSKNRSEVELVYQDKTGAVSQFMMKNIGTDKLPMKLTGLEFALSPDYGYTLGILAKGALKTKGKELVKEQATKILDKVIKNDDIKEKAGKLFKGLFK